MTIKEPCDACEGERWICENHPDKPQEHDDCCGAGMPCLKCNTNEKGVMPAMPPGFRTIYSRLKGWIH